MGLGERLNGIQEVSGSIPLISTKKKQSPFGGCFFALRLSRTADLLHFDHGQRFADRRGEALRSAVRSRLSLPRKETGFCLSLILYETARTVDYWQ